MGRVTRTRRRTRAALTSLVIQLRKAVPSVRAVEVGGVLVGGLLIALGASMIYVPAGVMLAGAELVALCLNGRS